MSRVDELIRELCPDGVESRPLRDLGIWQGGGTPSKHKPDYWRDGTTPWVTSGDMGDFELAATKYRITEAAVSGSAAKILPPNSVAVVMRSGILKHTLPVSLVPFRATVNQDLRAVICHHDVMPRYALHVLRANAQRVLIACRKVGGTVESIDVKKLMAFAVPVPPLEVQREIVRVLDLFTTLEAELEARRRQYAHYRDSLLTFPEGGVRWVPMGEVALFRRGTAITEKDVRPGEIPVVANGPVPVYFHDTVNRTGETIVVARSGAYAGAVSYWDVPLFLTDAFSIHPDANLLRPKYVFYWLSAQQDRLHGMKKGGGVPHVRVKELELEAIPIPALSEQVRIVAILDKFDALVNDLSIGLPAELAARRKQYEYYRDRLLTFEEAVA